MTEPVAYVSSSDAQAALKSGRRVDANYARVIGDSDDTRTWVVFSHVRIPKGSFAQSRVFDMVKGAKVFLNTPRNDWYEQGVPGVGDNLLDIADWLAQTLSCRDMSQVTFVGHSMGGYAALYFSGLFPGSQFVVTSPELALGQSATRSRDNGVDERHPVADLYRVLPQENRSSHGITVFGAYDPIDAGFLSQERTHDGRFGTIYAAPHHHGVTEYLTQNRLYLSLLENRHAYADALVAKGRLQAGLDEGIRDRLWTFCELKREWESGQMDRAIKLAGRYQTWDNPGWLSLVSTVARLTGDLATAVDRARRAARLEPQIAEYLLAYALCAKQAGDTQGLEEAESSMTRMAKPHRAIVRYLDERYVAAQHGGRTASL